MIHLTYNKPQRIFQLSHRHGYLRDTSPPRIRQLITPVSYCPFFVSSYEFLSLSRSYYLSLFFLWHSFCALFFVSLDLSRCLSVFLMSLSLIQEFFRNLSHWMDQHAAMNDAGNFLIETCDETVSLDLKQQLLLLNGRWRDLFLKVKQVTNKNNNKYYCMSETSLKCTLLYT